MWKVSESGENYIFAFSATYNYQINGRMHRTCFGVIKFIHQVNDYFNANTLLPSDE